MEKNEHPIEKIMQEALVKLKSIIDVDTVVGSQMTTTDGTIIIPITKVSVGFMAGGGEYSQNTPPKNTEKEYPFAGGTGGGFSVRPLGFLIGKKGEMKYLSIDGNSTIDNIVKTVQEVLKKYK